MVTPAPGPDLAVPTTDDVDALHAIYADPRVWTHLPTGRHTEVARTRAMVEGWIEGWRRDGLSSWVLRETPGGPVVGHAGCAIRHDAFWNLGYRLAVEAHGRGYATAVSRLAAERARERRPDLPVVAFLLEHNTASGRVAEKAGLRLVHRAPDAGNPDLSAVRLVYADRDLSPGQLAATLR